jgi:hypothetical protein
MKLVKEIENIIEDCLQNDQPVEEIAHQILQMIRNKDIADIVD